MRKFIVAAVSALTITMSASLAYAQEQVTLRLHSFTSPQAPEAVHFITPYIEAVKEQSNGRLNIEFYPSMQLGGKPTDLIQQLDDGVVDFIVINTGVAPGRFTGLEGMDLPFISRGTPESQTAAVKEYVDKWLKDTEFKGIKIIHMHAAEGSFFTNGKPLRSLDDFKSMEMRAPGRYLGESLKALGGTPVGVPVPELYEALERGRIDGTAVNWPIITPYRFYEVTKYMLATPVYQNEIMILMSQASFDKLPKDLQEIMDKNLSLEKSQQVAVEVAKLKAKGMEVSEKNGNQVYTLTNEERAEWAEAVKPVYQMWIEDMNKRGMPGQEMFDHIIALNKKYGGE